MLAGFADSRQPGHVAVKGRLTRKHCFLAMIPD